MHEFVSGKKQQPTTVHRTRSTAVHGFDAGKQANRTDVRNVIRPTPVQTKLTLGVPNDRYEQEADAVADRVMRMSDTDVAQRVDKGTVQPMLIQRMSSEYKNALALRQTQGDEEAVQAKKNAGETASVTSHVESGINSIKGGGQPLDTTTRSFFEPRFGRDFGNVRVHTGGQAPDLSRSINARAFTFGNDVVFGSGQYRPSSPEGRRLLGHELTHVVQQGEASTDVIRAKGNPNTSNQKSTIKYYTVTTDEALMTGGKVFKSIEGFRDDIMKTKDESEWKLILQMHAYKGALALEDECVAGVGCIEEEDLRKIFDEKPGWVEWREKYGPTKVTLNMCYLTLNMAKAVEATFQRPGFKSSAVAKSSQNKSQCKTEVHKERLANFHTMEEYVNGDSKDVEQFLRELKKLAQNDYCNNSTVNASNDELLNYYFNEPPEGAWLSCIVYVNGWPNAISMYELETDQNMANMCISTPGFGDKVDALSGEVSRDESVVDDDDIQIRGIRIPIQ